MAARFACFEWTFRNLQGFSLLHPLLSDGEQAFPFVQAGSKKGKQAFKFISRTFFIEKIVLQLFFGLFFVGNWAEKNFEGLFLKKLGGQNPGKGFLVLGTGVPPIGNAF